MSRTNLPWSPAGIHLPRFLITGGARDRRVPFYIWAQGHDASQPYSGKFLGKAVKSMNRKEKLSPVCYHDEQAHDSVPRPIGRVSSTWRDTRTVWVTDVDAIDGWSELVVEYIRTLEPACQH